MTKESHTRLVRLLNACQTQGIDAFLVRDTSNIRWLTAFDAVFDTESAHALLVTPDKVLLHTDSRYSDAARSAAGASDIVAVCDERVSHAAFAVKHVAECQDEHVVLPAHDSGAAMCHERTACGANDMRDEGVHALRANSEKVLGIEDSISLAEYRALEKAIASLACDNIETQQAFDNRAAALSLVDTNNLVVNLRAVKDVGEIERLRAAQAITDAAFNHIVRFIKPGMTERQVQLELEGFMRCQGADDLAFGSIVAAGANGANPHAIPGDTRLEAGQCVVLDFGAKKNGYCSDMTRTIFLGEPQGDMLRAWETMLRANEEVQAFLKPGMTGKQAHDLAERILEDGGFGGKMGHGLGHGVGLDIHEQPNLNPRNEVPLEVGNVVTVEPGIYLPGQFGMRLEDFGVITETGFCRFTQSTHDLVVL